MGYVARLRYMPMAAVAVDRQVPDIVCRIDGGAIAFRLLGPGAPAFASRIRGNIYRLRGEALQCFRAARILRRRRGRLGDLTRVYRRALLDYASSTSAH